jgi:hypothetical protein
VKDLQVLAWAQRIVKKGNHLGPTHLLEVREQATLDEAQNAFHKIARVAHPDMHRTTMTADELDMLTSAYSRVSAAYQEFKSRRLGGRPSAPGMDGKTPPPQLRGISGIAPPPQPAKPTAKAPLMAPKAMLYYRKAESALRQGDFRTALLQLKMAIAADPQSPVLRQALTEVESEIKKG